MAPSIFEFNSFSKFLNATYRARKAERPSFTYREFAQELGITSSLLTLIASGRRRTTPDVLAKISAALKIDDDQLSYAELLAKRDRAGSADEESIWDNRIRIRRSLAQHEKKIEVTKTSFFTSRSPIHVAVLPS